MLRTYYGKLKKMLSREVKGRIKGIAIKEG